MVARTLVGASVWIGLAAVLIGCGSDTSGSGNTSTDSGGQSQSGGGASLSSAGSGGATASGGANSGDSSTTGGSTAAGGTDAAPGNGGNGGNGVGGTVASGGSSATSGTGGGGTGGTEASGGSGAAPAGGAGTGGAAPTGGAGGTSDGGTSSGGTDATTGGTEDSGGSAPTGGTGGDQTGEPPFTLPVTVDAWTPSDACKTKAAEILGTLSLSQKVAQMIQGETLSTTPAEVTSYQLGAVFGGGSANPPNNGAAAWADMASQYQDAGMSFGIPILYGIDAVHGHNNVKDATMFPHNIGLGCTRDADLVSRVFRATAEEVRGTGINWTFAPATTAARDERWGRTFESFSEDPNIVAWMGQVAIDGLQQGTNIGDPLSILGCAKHFAGDGDTANGEDQGDVVMDEATFHRLAVDLYQPLINSGVATVMISYSQYGTSSSDLERVTGSKALVTDLLKTEMGFAGIVVSDYNAIMKLPGAAAGTYPPPSAQQVAQGINAGLDMLMMAGTVGTDEKPNWKTALELLEAAANSGDVPVSRIDDAVTRIFQVKCEMGMFESGYSVTTDTSQIGSANHRAIAREAVSKSLVVLKNDDSLLPLPTSAKVLVAGTAADSMVKQCGGWTIDWQGLGTGTGHSADADTTAGTTILAGIRAAIGEGNVTFSQDGTGSAGEATAGIVVVGESPYAEQYGDTADLTLRARSSADDTALTNMLNNGLPTVLVIISGRPLIIDSYLTNANLLAVVAAWLPGSEGAGVADVLFGAVTPTGKLGHSWPKDGQGPVNWDDADYISDPPLFPIDHGLSW